MYPMIKCTCADINYTHAQMACTHAYIHGLIERGGGMGRRERNRERDK